MKKTMKSLILYKLILFLIIGLMPQYATANTIESEKNEALNFINTVRSKYKINPLVNDTNLDTAADRHCFYMYRNNSLTSIQEKDKRNYSGRFPWDRAAYYNYNNPYVSEFIDKGEKTYLLSLSNFINNPYSRITLFDPVYRDIGFGNLHEYYAFELGGKPIGGTYDYEVIYPYNNQTGVPCYWVNKFSVDPYREIDSKTNKSYGIPVTYTYYSNRTLKEIKVDTTKTEIINLDTNKKVKIQIKTPDNDRFLLNTLMLLPLETYELDSNYVVKIKAEFVFEDKIESVDKVIYFDTYTKNSTNSTLKTPITRGKFTQLLINTLDIPIRSIDRIEFRDVPHSHPYADFIYTAYYQNIIYGYGNGIFGPDQPITREEYITMIMRAYDQLSNDKRSFNTKAITLPFRDNQDISSWAVDSIKKAYDLKLVQGTTELRIEAKRYITEEEAKIVLYNLKGIMK